MQTCCANLHPMTTTKGVALQKINGGTAILGTSGRHPSGYGQDFGGFKVSSNINGLI